MTTHDRPRPGGTAPLAGHTVARIGYGAMQLEPAKVDTETAVTVLRRAVELGVDHLDTADFYGGGEVNRRIRAALHPYDVGPVLVTKVGAVSTYDGLVAAQRPAELRASVEANLAGLGAVRLDVVNLRRTDQPPGVVGTGDQRVDLDDQLAELVALREEGKLGAIGLSGIDARQLEAALPAGVACVQNGYNVLDRSHEPVLEICRREGVAWVPFFPLGSAFDRFPSVTDHPVVQEVAAELGAPASHVGLAWLLQHDAHTLLIPGTRSVEHLESNLAAGDLELPPDVVARLDALAA